MPRERRAGGGIDRLPSGRYRVRIVTPGGRRLNLGTHPTRRSAEAAYARSLTDQADGKSATPSAVTTPTLADYASSWVDTRLTKRGEPVRPRVKDLYLMQLRLHIVPAFGTSRLAGSPPPRSATGTLVSEDRRGQARARRPRSTDCCA